MNGTRACETFKDTVRREERVRDTQLQRFGEEYKTVSQKLKEVTAKFERENRRKPQVKELSDRNYELYKRYLTLKEYMRSFLELEGRKQGPVPKASLITSAPNRINPAKNTKIGSQATVRNEIFDPHTSVDRLKTISKGLNVFSTRPQPYKPQNHAMTATLRNLMNKEEKGTRSTRPHSSKQGGSGTTKPKRAKSAGRNRGEIMLRRGPPSSTGVSSSQQPKNSGKDSWGVPAFSMDSGFSSWGADTSSGPPLADRFNNLGGRDHWSAVAEGGAQSRAVRDYSKKRILSRPKSAGVVRSRPQPPRGQEEILMVDTTGGAGWNQGRAEGQHRPRSAGSSRPVPAAATAKQLQRRAPPQARARPKSAGPVRARGIGGEGRPSESFRPPAPSKAQGTMERYVNGSLGETESTWRYANANSHLTSDTSDLISKEGLQYHYIRSDNIADKATTRLLKGKDLKEHDLHTVSRMIEMDGETDASAHKRKQNFSQWVHQFTKENIDYINTGHNLYKDYHPQ